MVEARIFVNKIPIYGDQHKAYTIMSRLGNILPVIRSWPHAQRTDHKKDTILSICSEAFSLRKKSVS